MNKLEKAVSEYMQTPVGDGLHNMLKGIANRAYLQRDDCKTAEGLEAFLLSVMAQRFGAVDDKGKLECKNTAQKTVDNGDDVAAAAKSPIKKKVLGAEAYKDERKAWRIAQDEQTELFTAIKTSDLNVNRTKTREAVKAIFKNCETGNVWFGEENESKQKNWITTSSIDSIGVAPLISTCTFGDNKRKDKDGNELGTLSRGNGNVKQIAAMLIELDSPLEGGEMTGDEVRALPLAEKIAYSDKVLKDTCIILTKAGLKPTTITYSGGRSYHVLIRLATPITAERFAEQKATLASAYARIGADSATLTASRLTRMPLGSTLLQAKEGDVQRLVYIDDTAEIEFDDFCDKLKALADSIAEEKQASSITLPMVTEDTKDGKQIWKYSPYRWMKFLKDIHLSKVWRGDEASLLLTDEETGVSEWLDAEQAFERTAQIIAQENPMAAAQYVAARASIAKDKTLSQYALESRKFNPLKDTLDCVKVPFANGTLVITKDSVDLIEGYEGCDVTTDDPTIFREWLPLYEKGEFEEFVERACGKLEGDAIWKDRYKGICTLLGYMICNKKEEVNYFNCIVEETPTENDGGTGKSIIMGSLEHWRKLSMKDMKNYNDQTRRFFWAGIARDKPRVVQFDDLTKDTNLEDFYTLITGKLCYERKGQDERTMSRSEMPKLIGATNFFPKGAGNSHDRRINIFEISNHYNKEHKPLQEFGHRLFESWSDDEWRRYDVFMAKCVKAYLTFGLIPCMGKNSAAKKLDANLGIIKDFFDDKTTVLPWWTTGNDLIKDYAEWHKNEYGAYPKIQYSSRTIAAKLKLYCDLSGLVFDNGNNATRRHDGKPAKWICVDNGNMNKSESFDGAEGVTESVTEGVTVTETRGDQLPEVIDDDCDFIKDAPDYVPKSAKSVTERNEKASSVTKSYTLVTPQTIDNTPLTESVTDVTEIRQTFCTNEKNKNLSENENYVGVSVTKLHPTGDMNNNAKIIKRETLYTRDGKPFEVAIPEPPKDLNWGIDDGVLVANYDFGSHRVVYCKGRIPEPEETKCGKYYKVFGSTYKASGIGKLDRNDSFYIPTAFVIV